MINFSITEELQEREQLAKVNEFTKKVRPIVEEVASTRHYNKFILVDSPEYLSREILIIVNEWIEYLTELMDENRMISGTPQWINTNAIVKHMKEMIN